MRLEGKVAIVSGAGRGIGLAIAKLFAAEGAEVLATDLNLPGDEEAPRLQWRRLDVTDEGDWRDAIAHVVAEHGKLDVLVNNAGGVGSYDPIETVPIEVWQKIIELNQTGPFYGIRNAIPELRRSGGGSIVNVSSIWGIAGVAGVAPYQATKGALRLMSKNVAMSYVDDGIRVNSIHPGIIKTPLIEAQDADLTDLIVQATPMKRLGKPEDIAYGALYLASDESAYVTGTELVIDGGYTCI